MKDDKPAEKAEQGTAAPVAKQEHAHEWHATAVGQKGIVCTFEGCTAKLGESDKAPAEARAEERGHIDPVPQLIRGADGRVVGRTAHALSDHKSWIYECAKVHWGTWDEQGRGTPGGAGKLLTGPEYDAFVTKAMGVTAR